MRCLESIVVWQRRLNVYLLLRRKTTKQHMIGLSPCKLEDGIEDPFCFLFVTE